MTEYAPRSEEGLSDGDKTGYDRAGCPASATRRLTSGGKALGKETDGDRDGVKMPLVSATPALGDDAGGGREGETRSMPFRWATILHAVREGDRYDLVVTNTSGEAQDAWVHTTIMDHRNRTNTSVVDDRVRLEPGEERGFTVIHDHGTANRFTTRIRSETQNLGLVAKVTDPAGNETARFDDSAFAVRGREVRS